ncbi:MAG: DegT/DnrJ/EryC1/StrS family aminotransferase [Isosphaeraceae bacterium]|nr:DegT/DnrJ/EryC1/StrS family aminotransferase [Isosphaeraceae bacterium]
MNPDRTSRRRFLGAGLALSGTSALGRSTHARINDSPPAILGGTPLLSNPRTAWPIIGEIDVKAWVDVLRSGKWNRLNGTKAVEFETAWAERLGSRFGLATANGTSALFTSLNALGVGPGDEVIVPSYTFVATINAVLLQHAIPVFVDTDRETFQIDARKIEQAITPRTTCILPAHIGGSPADLDAILEIGRRRGIPVIEDACQAHLAEWRGKRVGSLGTLGCFSFQASKNLNSGEGGAVVTDDERLIQECRSFHNNGRSAPGDSSLYSRNGCNLRLTEFQAALLLAQMTRLDAQSKTRDVNAARLTERLQAIPGIQPAKQYPGCTRNAYHLYMFRYDATQFSGLPRAGFLRALSAEGIAASGGYTPLTDEPFLRATLESKGYRAIYGRELLEHHLDRMKASGPENAELCREAVWFTQTTLLGDPGDMDRIADAIERIRTHADRIVKL